MRRPNECPRCSFAYTAFNRPKPANTTFSQRFIRNLRERRKYGLGHLADARYAEAEHTRPWQCRCGTWLRADPWRFGAVDVLGIAAIVVGFACLAVRFTWAQNGWAFALPIGLWVGYRTASQVSVTEVPAAEIPADIVRYPTSG